MTGEISEMPGAVPVVTVTVAGDEVARRKPHPDLLLAACEKLGVSPQQTLLIGDSGNDAQAAHAAGCTSLLVETGYNEGEPVHDLAGSAGVGGIFPTLFDAARSLIDSLPG